jgi:hypothetical protein
VTIQRRPPGGASLTTTTTTCFPPLKPANQRENSLAVTEPGAAANQVRSCECSTDPVPMGREQIRMLLGDVTFALRCQFDFGSEVGTGQECSHHRGSDDLMCGCGRSTWRHGLPSTSASNKPKERMPRLRVDTAYASGSDIRACGDSQRVRDDEPCAAPPAATTIVRIGASTPSPQCRSLRAALRVAQPLAATSSDERMSIAPPE